MKSHNSSTLGVCLLGLCLALPSCQKNEQSAVQPEKLSASASGVSSAPSPEEAKAAGSAPAASDSSAPGPLLPFASGKGPQDVKPPPATDKTAKPAGPRVADKPTNSVSSEIQLIKAGAEPRKELRLKAKTGQVDKMKMVMTMGLEMKVDGQQAAPPQDMPPMVMNLDLKVIDTKPNGDIRYDFIVTDTDVLKGQKTAPKVVQGMKAALGKINGMKGHAVVSNRGFNKEANIDMPPGTDAQTKQVMQGMQQALQQLGAPLPKEPVGQGAQWKFVTKLVQQGIKVRQSATYDLIKLDGNNMTCNVKVDQTAPRQRIAAMGVSVDLLSLSSTGGGKTDQRLDKLAPLKSNMNMVSKVDMGMPKNQVMNMTTRMVIDIASK